MKIAFLMLCHKFPGQVNALAAALARYGAHVYIHPDALSGIGGELRGGDNIFILPESLREKVIWGGFSVVRATLELMDYALERDDYDYLWLISGQDVPLVSVERMTEFLKAGGDRNYIRLYPEDSRAHRRYLKRTRLYYNRVDL